MEGQGIDPEQHNIPSQHSFAFDNNDFRDYSFESPRSWVFQEQFFNIPEEELPTLSVSEIDRLIDAVSGDVQNNNNDNFLALSEPCDQEPEAPGQTNQLQRDKRHQGLVRSTDNLTNVRVGHRPSRRYILLIQ